MRKHISSFLFGTIFISIVLRLFPIFPYNFVFMYDNAKDSLSMFDMFYHVKPALVGAVTSISGVFNGPAWYYIALPLNIWMKFNPLASVLTVIFLSGVMVSLAYKYLGKIEAMLLAISIGLITSQITAWIPYLTPFAVLPLLILLKTVNKDEFVTPLQAGFIGLFLALLFHSQAAFGTVFMPAYLFSIFLIKPKMSLRTAVCMILGFILPMLPLILFELRHDFHQTNMIIDFILHYKEQSHILQPNNPSLLGRIVEVSGYMFETLKRVGPINSSLFGFVTMIVIGYVLVKKDKLRTAYLPLIVIPFLLYQVFPCKAYYLVGMYPLWIVLFAEGVRALAKRRYEKKTIDALVFIVLVLSLCSLVENMRSSYNLRLNSTYLFQTKLDAVKKVYKLADNEPFDSYHFLPEVYDYSYQHTYYMLSKQGYKLPNEFSYAPGETTYLQWKELPNETQTKLVFLIVEKYSDKQVFDGWWNRVTQNLSILETYTINDAVTVYKAERVDK